MGPSRPRSGWHPPACWCVSRLHLVGRTTEKTRNDASQPPPRTLSGGAQQRPVDALRLRTGDPIVCGDGGTPMGFGDPVSAGRLNADFVRTNADFGWPRTLELRCFILR